MSLNEKMAFIFFGCFHDIFKNFTVKLKTTTLSVPLSERPLFERFFAELRSSDKGTVSVYKKTRSIKLITD
jgi:hypothetical protein